MKIGIITFHHSLNCGAALQAWALQTYLRKCGYDASLINYGMIGWPSKYSLCLNSIKGFVKSLIKNGLLFFRSFIIEDYRRRLYRRFMHEQMKLGAVVEKEAIGSNGYTHIITGSDQVWHPVINEGDDTYFLANIQEDLKRISYAPSFGIDSFESDYERKMSDWLSRFDALSVREPKGAEVVRRLCGRNAAIVCDPTLLLSRRDYEAIERKPYLSLPKNYIAVYTVCGHPWAENAAIKLGNEMGLPVIHLPGGQFARWYFPSKVHHITALGPSEWLWFLHHAKYVVTNSFHGTVFSLLYHKPFTVALNGKASDERMASLLDGVKLKTRLQFKNTPIIQTDIDWQFVDDRLCRLAESGRRFIKEALT